MRSSSLTRFVCTTVALLLIGMLNCAFYLFQGRLLNEIFPRNEPNSQRFWSGTPYFVQKRDRTIEFFGIDPLAGRIMLLRMYGRPALASFSPPIDFGSSLYPGGPRFVRTCSYRYPGLKVSFVEGSLTLIDITDPHSAFPIGIRVGDPAQHVYDIFGRPNWHYAWGSGSGNIVQDDYALIGRLSVYLSQGRVSRIIWG